MAWRRRPPRKESRLRENSSSHTVKPVASGEGPRVGPRSRSPPDTPPLGPRSAPLGTDPPAAPARAHTPPARQAQPGQAAAAALGTARHDPASEAPGEPRLGCEGARARGPPPPIAALRAAFCEDRLNRRRLLGPAQSSSSSQAPRAPPSHAPPAGTKPRGSRGVAVGARRGSQLCLPLLARRGLIPL